MIKSMIRVIFKWVPKRNIIIFESAPDYADNTRAVFDEMIRRGMNQKYRLYWKLRYKEAEKLPVFGMKNVYTLTGRGLGIIRSKWTRLFAKMFISCNDFQPRFSDDQYSIFLCHGGALKDCNNDYNAPERINKILCFSEYLAPYDAKNLGAPVEKMLPLGYPRNDMLFGAKLDLHRLFPDADFQKCIYWMPTYRQHRNGSERGRHSDISMPILYTTEIAQRINDFAAETGVLLIVKPHPAQDVSKINALRLSNLRFIDNDFLDRQGMINYQLLASVDALITDYSSVYYDYLLTDKPIGLCWDDFDSYSEKEGFILDPHEIMAGGEKIYTPEELCGFIRRVADGTDILREERTKLKKQIHLYDDGQSTKRVVDYLEEILNSR